MLMALGGKPLLYANHVAAAFAERRISPPAGFARANSFLNPLGREPAKGWLLMARGDLLSLDREGLHALTLSDDIGTVQFTNLVIIRAQNLIPGKGEDATAPYLVTVADSRWRCHNPHFSAGAVSKFYNCRARAYPDGTLMVASQDGVDDWTWDTMIEDLWTLVETQLGSFPGISPASPDGDPRDFNFVGVPAWPALCDVLERIGCAVAWNGATYDICQVGTESGDTTQAMEQAKSGGFCIHDDEPLESYRGRIPDKVTVCFHSWREHGAEASVDKSASQWQTSSVYTKEITLGASGETDVSHCIWDDLPALLDIDGLVTNQSDIDARAQSRADDYLRGLRTGGELLYQQFAGIWEFAPEGVIRGVAWKQSAETGGWATECVRHAAKTVRAGDAGRWEEVPPLAGNSTQLHGPSFRPTWPIYPPHAQVIEVPAGNEPDGDGLIEGTIKVWDSDSLAWVDRGDCLAVPLPADHHFARIVGSKSDKPVLAFYGCIAEEGCECTTELEFYDHCTECTTTVTLPFKVQVCLSCP